jgi:hypothetical protein
MPIAPSYSINLSISISSGAETNTAQQNASEEAEAEEPWTHVTRIEEYDDLKRAGIIHKQVRTVTKAEEGWVEAVERIGEVVRKMEKLKSVTCVYPPPTPFLVPNARHVIW